MNQTDLHRLPGMLSGKLQHCFEAFRPDDEPMVSLYEHIVQSNCIGALLSRRLSQQEGVGLNEWFDAWRESADELVPDQVQVDYTARDLEEARARANCVLLAWSMDEDGRERMLHELRGEFSGR